jgi:hypothetical protein
MLPVINATNVSPLGDVGFQPRQQGLHVGVPASTEVLCGGGCTVEWELSKGG